MIREYTNEYGRQSKSTRKTRNAHKILAANLNGTHHLGKLNISVGKGNGRAIPLQA
jgi:hypothetical protein